MSKDNAPDLQVSTGIKELAAAIKKDLKIGEGGVVAVDKDFYQSHLPDSVSMADVNRIQSHNSDLISAVGLALGELSIDHMAKHKDVSMTSLKFKAGKDEITLGVDRTRTSRDPKSGNTIEKFGVASAKITVFGAKNSSGSWKHIRNHLNDVGGNKLNK